MIKLFGGHQLHLIDQIALLAGRKLDLVYASLAHQLRLSPGFFRQGWGDLGVVDFEEDAKLFQSWPPPHFDQQVSAISEALLGVTGGPTLQARSKLVGLQVQLNWKKREEGKRWGVECETFEVSFRSVITCFAFRTVCLCLFSLTHKFPSYSYAGSCSVVCEWCSAASLCSQLVCMPLSRL